MNFKKSKLVLLYFQLCGICNFAHYVKQASENETLFFNILALFHLSVLTTIVILVIHYAEQIFMKNDMIITAIDILQWLLPVLSQYVSIIESLCTTAIRRQFWEKLFYMDTHLLNTTPHHLHRSMNKFIFKAVFILISSTTIQIFVMIRIPSSEPWHNHMVITFYTYVVCRSEVLFCVYFIDMLKCRTDMLSIRLNQMADAKNIRNPFNKLRCYKQSYGLMWQSMENINQAFG